MNPEDRAEEKRLKSAEYEQREYRKEKRRVASLARSKAQTVITTKKRIEEHTMDELLYMACLRCGELGLDYGANEATFRAAFEMLHGP